MIQIAKNIVEDRYKSNQTGENAYRTNLDCIKRIEKDKIAKDFNIPVLARIPMEESTSQAVDAGDIESVECPYLDVAVETVKKLL